MLGPIQNAEIFLVNTVFDIYLLILMIRLILCWARASYYNPITQFIVKCTQPLITPLRRTLPTVKNIELSTLLIIIVLETLKFLLLGLVALGMPKNPLGLFILGIADTLKLLLNTFFYAIFLQAILSWIQQGYSPVSQLLGQLTFPIMRRIQPLVPPVGGFDLSPILALVLLQLLIIVIVNPLLAVGMSLSFG